MSTETTKTTEADTETLDPKELARRLMVAAARFAAASMQAFGDTYPEQVKLLAGTGGSFGVRVSDILSTHPRCSLTNMIGTEEVEIAHVVLQQPAPMNPLRMN